MTRATLDPAVGRSLRRVTQASLALALLLLLLKVAAVWQTGSVAVLASLTDTTLDVLASLVTFVALRIALQPADMDHQFGHGKAEAIAALVQTMVIAGSSLLLVAQSLRRLLDPVPVAAPEVGIGVSLVAVVGTLALVAYQRTVVRRTGSIAVKTDKLHYESDLWLNLSVIAALACDRWLGLPLADPLFALGIAAYIGWGAWTSARHALDMLMDREWDLAERKEAAALITSHPRVLGVHELRTRRSGMDEFLQFHIWVDPDISVREAHVISDAVEALLRQRFPRAELLVHIDPAGLQEQYQRDVHFEPLGDAGPRQ